MKWKRIYKLNNIIIALFYKNIFVGFAQPISQIFTVNNVKKLLFAKSVENYILKLIFVLYAILLHNLIKYFLDELNINIYLYNNLLNYLVIII